VALDRPLLAYKGHTEGPHVQFTDLLAQAKPAERTIRLCLRGDLVAQFEELDRKRVELEGRADEGSLAGSPAVQVARQMEQLQAEMRDSTYPFRVRALSRKAYQALVAAHPPRRDAEGAILPEDLKDDINTATFWEPLIRACLVDPVLDDAEWEHLAEDILSDRQFEQLAIAAFVASRGNVDIPFSHGASETLKNSGNGSKAPSDSGSLSSASTDGNPPPSTSTTATD
jgi:hypothetical protein